MSEKKASIDTMRTAVTLLATAGAIIVLWQFGRYLSIFPSIATELLKNNDWISPKGYNDNKNKVTITTNTGLTLANDIYYAKGYIWDTESNVTGAISAAGTKVNVSYVSFLFQNQYGQDMRTYLTSFMSHEQVQSVMTTLRELPKF
jgi:hypothetical protein